MTRSSRPRQSAIRDWSLMAILVRHACLSNPSGTDECGSFDERAVRPLEIGTPQHHVLAGSPVGADDVRNSPPPKDLSKQGIGWDVKGVDVHDVWVPIKEVAP